MFRKLLIKLISRWKYYRQLKIIFLISFPLFSSSSSSFSTFPSSPFSLFLFLLFLSSSNQSGKYMLLIPWNVSTFFFMDIFLAVVFLWHYGKQKHYISEGKCESYPSHKVSQVTTLSSTSHNTTERISYLNMMCCVLH